eukprot:COSAG06_NODE_5402_length_3504_cov_2.398532_2_plen_513_part_00
MAIAAHRTNRWLGATAMRAVLLLLLPLLLLFPISDGRRRKKLVGLSSLKPREEPRVIAVLEQLRRTAGSHGDEDGAMSRRRMDELCAEYPRSFEAAEAHGLLLSERRPSDEEETVRFAAAAARELGRALELTSELAFHPRLLRLETTHLSQLRAAHAERSTLVPAGMKMVRRVEQHGGEPDHLRAITDHYGWESAKIESDLIKDGAAALRRDLALWNEIETIGRRLSATKGIEWGYNLRSKLLHDFALAVALDATGDVKGASQAFAAIPAICQGRTECNTDDAVQRLLQSVQAQSRHFARVTWGGTRRELAPPVRDYDPTAALADWETSWQHELEHGGGGGSSGAVDAAACDIDRRENLSESEFHRDYVTKGRPVLMKGLLADWPGRKVWSRAGLLESAGDTTVTVMRTSQVSSSEQRLGAKKTTEQSLTDYFTTMLGSGSGVDGEGQQHHGATNNNQTEDDVPYVFQKGIPREIMRGFRHLQLFDSEAHFPRDRRDRCFRKHSTAVSRILS